ncbi:hypothetical protein ACEPAG_3877 [Sanghuangporus baumii]
MAYIEIQNARASDDEAKLEQRGADGCYLFSEKELVVNLVTFLVAGDDPTAHAITFAIYEILKKPDVLMKLQVELDTLLPHDCEVPTIEQVSRLRYLNFIIKETLRYNGPGFGSFRYTSTDVEIYGYKLPANTTLALWNPQVHRDLDSWGLDADEFYPDRWHTKDGQDAVEGPRFIPTPDSYFPFSYGPRKCLGEGLAMLEMSLNLVTLFKRYDLTLHERFNMEFLPSFTLFSKNGLPVKAHLRA